MREARPGINRQASEMAATATHPPPSGTALSSLSRGERMCDHSSLGSSQLQLSSVPERRFSHPVATRALGWSGASAGAAKATMTSSQSV